jgi:DNA polymerase-3 subunit gamma/tau
MTLLRALAFHPQAPLPEPEVKPLPATLAAPVQAAPVSAPPVPPPQNLPQTTSQVLAARSQLQRSQGAPTQKE